MNELHFSGIRGIFDTLFEAAAVTRATGRRPDIWVNGKLYKHFDLLKIAALMPDESLSAVHQAKADAEFKNGKSPIVAAALTSLIGSTGLRV